MNRKLRVLKLWLLKLRFMLLRFWTPRIRRKTLRIGAVILGVCIIGGSSFSFIQNRPAFLLADGQQLALVAGKSQVNKALEMAREELTAELGAVILGTSSELSWRSKGKSTVQPLKDEELVSILKERLAWVTNTWAIQIDEEPVLSLASEGEAQEVLESLQTFYFPQDSTQLKIEKSEFQEEVKIVLVQGLTQQLKTKNEAIEILTKGREKKAEHLVKKGESLWTIARDHDLTVAELREMNSSLKGTYLQPGDLLSLKKMEPLVTVVSTATFTVEEKVPYKIVYESDASLWHGQERVKEAGTNGVRKVTYRITLANDLELGRQIVAKKTLRESKPQVVRQGAKMIVASRGGGGNGALSWPARGKITCAYGTKRGKGIHTGIDIDGNRGDPVFAAGKGTVISAGWKGSYGNCVDIDHGQGLSTRYAHLNEIDVSAGQNVSAQSVVGKVGSTGHSTGSHLHFEVRVNGQYTNPLRYLD